jgi:hypothetical protein
MSGQSFRIHIWLGSVPTRIVPDQLAPSRPPLHVNSEPVGRWAMVNETGANERTTEVPRGNSA